MKNTQENSAKRESTVLSTETRLKIKRFGIDEIKEKQDRNRNETG
jgi:hypothetical protein